MNQTIAGDIDAVMPTLLDSGLMSTLCTIIVPAGVVNDTLVGGVLNSQFDAGGAPDPTIPGIPLSGCQNIPCTAPPLSYGGKVLPTEVKELKQIMAKTPLHVLLGGYFPQILSHYIAVINNLNFEIMGVEHDSQQQMTRLAVQLATV